MKDFKKKSITDLERLVTEKREALREFRFKSAGSRTRNVKEGRNMRRDIARILTELHMRSRVEK